MVSNDRPINPMLFQHNQEEMSSGEPEEGEQEVMTINGKFMCKKKINQGGYGKIYLAIDKVQRCPVVVKINKDQNISEHEHKVLQLLNSK